MALAAKVAVNPLPWVLGPEWFRHEPDERSRCRRRVSPMPASPRCTPTCRPNGHRPSTARCSRTTACARRRAISEPTSTGRPRTCRSWSSRPSDMPSVQLELGQTEVFLASHLNPAGSPARPSAPTSTPTGWTWSSNGSHWWPARFATRASRPASTPTSAAGSRPSARCVDARRDRRLGSGLRPGHRPPVLGRQ